jgi:hypothetical protein
MNLMHQRYCNNLTSKIGTAIIFLITGFTISYCQDSTRDVSRAWAELKVGLAARAIDTSQIIGDKIDIDRSIHVNTIAGGRISDPYKTLQGSFVFAIRTADASVDTNAMIVIMKKGSIIWTSERFAGEFGGRIEAILDLNKDSVVDILSEWVSGSRQDQRRLWIHSWDGTHGRAINATIKRYSALKAVYFRIKDSNVNDVKEIQGDIGKYEPENGFKVKGIVTYRWDGRAYVESKEQRQEKE